MMWYELIEINEDRREKQIAKKKIQADVYKIFSNVNLNSIKK